MTVDFNEMVEEEMFNQADWNEYFVKDVVEAEKPSKAGNKMWLMHLLPIWFQNEKKNKFGKYSKGFVQYIIFDDDGSIMNKSFIDPVVDCLRTKEKLINKALEKACGDAEFTLWIKGEYESYEYKGKSGMKIVMGKFQDKKPTPTEIMQSETRAIVENDKNEVIEDDTLPF